MESTRPGTEWKLVSDKDHLHHAEDSVPLSDDSGKKKKTTLCCISQHFPISPLLNPLFLYPIHFTQVTKNAMPSPKFPGAF